MPDAAAIPEALTNALRESRFVCALTGAGISAESGVPTFRDAQRGLWARYDPQQLATPEAFLDDPALVWRWYRWRRERVAGAEPNAAHKALVSLAARVPQFALITQNVDGLHQRAGSTGVTEFHGNLFDNRCFNECSLADAPDTGADVPLCPRCNGPLRPGVVWFGETIPAAALESAQSAITQCDVYFSIGTSSLVWPAAGFAEAARQRGATTVEVNPDPTPMSDRFDFRLTANAGDVLPKLVDCLAL